MLSMMFTGKYGNTNLRIKIAYLKILEHLPQPTMVTQIIGSTLKGDSGFFFSAVTCQ